MSDFWSSLRLALRSGCWLDEVIEVVRQIWLGMSGQGCVRDYVPKYDVCEESNDWRVAARGIMCEAYLNKFELRHGLKGT